MKMKALMKMKIHNQKINKKEKHLKNKKKIKLKINNNEYNYLIKII